MIQVEVIEMESPSVSSNSSNSYSPFRPRAHQIHSIYPPDNPSQAPFPHYQHGNHYHHTNQPGQQQVSSGPHPQHKSAPASPVRQPHGATRVSTPSPNPGRFVALVISVFGSLLHFTGYPAVKKDLSKVVVCDIY